ncbi:UPF0197 transmembrane protein [Planoprotostelium fungivorum]|uniref:Dolichyl-diphosphooligosaccharide-protein glycosyltransferase subunit OST5 n=1 Tax=Planoprotostelium fungivorum TaxID=1890364 RepID=A0A2P6NPF5_9EUKA|nr:UPF0197 transmembrane protein [Planoprotostelium fungivorum]
MSGQLYPYYGPVSQALYPTLTLFLNLAGLFFFSLFIIYEVTHVGQKNLFRELSLAGLASFFLGFGTLFLLLWTGVYV